MIFFTIAMTAAIVFSVLGDLFVKKGASRLKEVNLQEFGGIHSLAHPESIKEIIRESGFFRNKPLLTGIGLLALHFIGFMTAMRLAPVTVVVPLMSCTYVATTLMAKIYLKEEVSRLRWAGIGVIMAGVILIGLSTLNELPIPGETGAVGAVKRVQRRMTSIKPLPGPGQNKGNQASSASL